MPPTKADAIQQARDVVATEARALLSLAESIDEPFMRAVSVLWMCRGRIIVTGMGKAGLVGAKIAATLRSTGTLAAFLNPAEALHGDMGMIGPDDVLLALSNSGETDEVRAVAQFCKQRSIEIVAVTSKPDSPLAREAKIAVILPASPEGCPLGKAPMASAIMMMALGDAMTVRLMSMRGFTEADFLALHHGGYLGRSLQAVA